VKTLTEEQKYFYLKALDYRIWQHERNIKTGYYPNDEYGHRKFQFPLQDSCPLCEAFNLKIRDCSDCPARSRRTGGDGYCYSYLHDHKPDNIQLESLKRKRTKVLKMEVSDAKSRV